MYCPVGGGCRKFGFSLTSALVFFSVSVEIYVTPPLTYGGVNDESLCAMSETTALDEQSDGAKIAFSLSFAITLLNAAVLQTL